MSGVLIELPAELQGQVAEAATRNGVSASVWLAAAVRPQLDAEAQLAARAARADADAARRVLAMVPHVPPVPGDELSPDRPAGR